jgi:hypothetical protein
MIVRQQVELNVEVGQKDQRGKEPADAVNRRVPDARL